MSDIRPLVLVDLDDNLFQTARKMSETPQHIASRDVDGQPSGYMTGMQQQFVAWLLASADVVPVTARSIEAFNRVDIAFTGPAICSNGGVILSAQGVIDTSWHQHMLSVLAPYQQRFHELSKQTLDIGQQLGLSLRGWVVEEVNTCFYVVTKHNNLTDNSLLQVLDEVRRQGLIDDLFVHINGNNLAFMPKTLNKKYAVQELIQRDQAIHGARPILGFGDSLSDLGFMSECQFWGTPKESQITTMVLRNLSE